jgi:outer membrane lipoprotein-sorting protein
MTRAELPSRPLPHSLQATLEPFENYPIENPYASDSAILTIHKCSLKKYKGVPMRYMFMTLLILCLALPLFATPTVQDLTTQMKAVSAKVLDFQGTMVTTIKSSLLGNMPITQTAKVFKKGEAQTRMEMTIPGMAGQPAQKQTTITSGNETWVIDNDGVVTKLESPMAADKSGLRGSPGTADPTKYLDYFDLTVTETSTNYVIVGTPKAGSALDGNDYFGKLVTTVDKAAMVPTQMKMFKRDGSLLMTATMVYQVIDGCEVMTKTVAAMTIPSMGTTLAKPQTMEVTSEYKDVAINKGIGAEVFGVGE